MSLRFRGHFWLLLMTVACRAHNNSVVLEEKPEVTVSTRATVKEKDVSWTSKNGNIYLNDNVFHLKGVNWFGLETPGTWLLGLEYRSMDSILDLLAENNVNSIRVPISVKYSLDLDFVPTQQNFKEDQDLIGKPWSSVLRKLIEHAADRGITVLLDMHTMTPGDNLSTGLWYTEQYSKEKFRKAWVNVLNAFGSYWNIWGVDLKNELHEATWGANKESDWNVEVETIVPLLKAQSPHYRGLYVVQGIWHGQIGDRAFGGYHDAGRNKVVVTDPNGYGAPHFWDYWWGGNLLGVQEFPLRLNSDVEDKIAYTIHFYGPAVWPIWYYNAPSVTPNALGVYETPSMLDQVLAFQHSFIEKSTGKALIIGEWGGRNGPITRNMGEGTPMVTYDDSVIVNRVAEWFPKNCMADAMWWAINPESGDTGGLLKPGYETVEDGKFAVMKKMMPYPSVLSFDRPEGEIQWKELGKFHPEANCQP